MKSRPVCFEIKVLKWNLIGVPVIFAWMHIVLFFSRGW